MKAIPKWLPDWQNVEDYPDKESTTPQEWAWEFLRRNQFFQHIYATKYQALISKIASQDEDIKVLLQSKRAQRYQDPVSFLTEDPMGKRFLDIIPEVERFCHSIQEEFFVSAPGGMPNPAHSYADAQPYFPAETQARLYKPSSRGMHAMDDFLPPNPIHSLLNENEIEKIRRNKEEEIKVRKKPLDLIIKLDPTKNKTPQMKVVSDFFSYHSKQLEELGLSGRTQTRQGKVLRDKLRVHDARLLSVKRRIIASEIFPNAIIEGTEEGEKRVDQYHKDALSYIEEEYITIAST